MSNDTKKTQDRLGQCAVPEKIADEVWPLVTKRDRVEAIVPAPPAK